MFITICFIPSRVSSEEKSIGEEIKEVVMYLSDIGHVESYLVRGCKFSDFVKDSDEYNSMNIDDIIDHISIYYTYEVKIYYINIQKTNGVFNSKSGVFSGESCNPPISDGTLSVSRKHTIIEINEIEKNRFEVLDGITLTSYGNFQFENPEGFVFLTEYDEYYERIWYLEKQDDGSWKFYRFSDTTLILLEGDD